MMGVQVHCPNPACGKTSTVPDDLMGRRVKCAHCGQKFTPAATVESGPAAETRAHAGKPAALPASAAVPQQIGRFQIRARLGSGAFGTVYRAYDPQLEREVALKVPQPGTLGDAQKVERFLREARAAARLRHPHIVPVYDAGHDGEHYYIASAFIEGRTLAGAIDEGPFDFCRAARIIRDLAEALAHAHGQGIVHRDVKSANIMLDDKGAAYLMDFGLAHRQDAQAKLTQEGAILGTPAYIAPEQAQSGEPLPASDQYSLGVVLYELLCGQTPFRGPCEFLIFNAIHRDPPSPRGVRRGVPRDLETICLRALSKRPEARYATCQDFADDIRRWLDGKPIQARRAGPIERAVRWCQRQPALAAACGLAAALFIAVIAAVGIGLTSGPATEEDPARRAEAEARQREDEQRRQAEMARLRVEREQAEAEAQRRTEQAGKAEADAETARQAKQQAELETEKARKAAAEKQAALEAEKARQSGKPLESTPAKPPSVRAVLGQERQALRFVSNVYDVSFSPDGKLLATISDLNNQGKVMVWDPDTGAQLAILEEPSRTSMAFSPDGKFLASGTHSGKVMLWDTAARKEPGSFPASKEAGGSVHILFSPDSKTLAGYTSDSVILWDVRTGQVRATVKAHKRVNELAFAPDSHSLASAGNDETAKLWDAATGNLKGTLKLGGPGGSRSVGLGFSPDGTRLVTLVYLRNNNEYVAKLWDVTTQKQLATLSHAAKPHRSELTRYLYYAGFSSDNKTLATAGWDGTVRLWDLSGQPQTALKGHMQPIQAMAFARNGRLLASGSSDKSVKLWDVNTAKEIAPLQHNDEVRSLAFAPDGRSLATVSGGQVKLWWVVSDPEPRAE